MQTHQIDINGMSCDHCMSKITGAIKSVGASSCKVDLASGRATVSFDESQTSISRIVQAVSAAGYSVEGFRRVEAAPSAHS